MTFWTRECTKNLCKNGYINGDESQLCSVGVPGSISTILEADTVVCGAVLGPCSVTSLSSTFSIDISTSTRGCGSTSSEVFVWLTSSSSSGIVFFLFLP